MQNILWVTEVFAGLGPDEKGSAEVCKAVEIVVGEDFDLTVEEPEGEMNGLKW